MTKDTLLTLVSERSGVSKKDSDMVIKAVVKTITSALKDGDKVQIPDLGTFETSKRSARVGRSPRTKESINIAACTVPKFKAAKALKEAVK